MNTQQINAVIVRLNIRVFSNQRQDPAMTEDVKLAHKLAGKAGKWVKYKLAEETLSGVRKAGNAARNQVHYKRTLPWQDGYAILPTAGREDYAVAMREAKDKFNSEADLFCEGYVAAVNAARVMHNGTFNLADYPDDPRGEFGFDVEYFPMPQSAHFTAELAAMFGVQLETLTARKIEEAMAETWERMLAPVAHMASVLGSPDQIFRDSLVENVREMVKLVPALNLTGDSGLASAIREVESKLATAVPQDLRELPIVRRDVAMTAKGIVERFGNMGGGRKFVA